MQFPLGRRMGASVGLVPYSSVGYSFGSEIDNGIDSRQGSGGVVEFHHKLASEVVVDAGTPCFGQGVVAAQFVFVGHFGLGRAHLQDHSEPRI